MSSSSDPPQEARPSGSAPAVAKQTTAAASSLPQPASTAIARAPLQSARYHHHVAASSSLPRDPTNPRPLVSVPAAARQVQPRTEGPVHSAANSNFAQSARAVSAEAHTQLLLHTSPAAPAAPMAAAELSLQPVTVLQPEDTTVAMAPAAPVATYTPAAQAMQPALSPSAVAHHVQLQQPALLVQEENIQHEESMSQGPRLNWSKGAGDVASKKAVLNIQDKQALLAHLSPSDFQAHCASSLSQFKKMKEHPTQGAPMLLGTFDLTQTDKATAVSTAHPPAPLSIA